MGNIVKWTVGIGVVVGLCSVLWADAQSDVESAKRDYRSAKSKLDDVKYKVDKYLEQSRGLRSFDVEKLNALIEQLCRQDTEPNDSEVDGIVRDLVDRAVDSVKRNYDDTSRTAYDRVGDVERLLDQTKAVRDRAKDLKTQDAVKDDASRLFDDAQKLVEEADKLMGKTQSDFRSLDNVKQGTMNGANNPTIRAKMEYGKQKHKDLQSSYSCDEREVVLSSGRPDCIKFAQDDCQIIEFKPDTYSTSAAEAQARQYLDDVRRKFKDDDRAKKCKQVDAYPFFRTVGVTYTACRS
jgi:hypothetical protein